MLDPVIVEWKVMVERHGIRDTVGLPTPSTRKACQCVLMLVALLWAITGRETFDVGEQ